MYPYHNKIKQRIKNKELIKYEYVDKYKEISPILTQIINLGFLGFILWIALLGYSIKKSKIGFNALFLSFACLMFFALISDDILERQVGVTIFSSILTILLFYNRKEKESLAE